jgi:hypothetical protein
MISVTQVPQVLLYGQLAHSIGCDHSCEEPGAIYAALKIDRLKVPFALIRAKTLP